MMTELKCFERNQRMNHTLSSSSSSTLSVSCEGWREGWLSCSQTVPVPVFERDMVADSTCMQRWMCQSTDGSLSLVC